MEEGGKTLNMSPTQEEAAELSPQTTSLSVGGSFGSLRDLRVIDLTQMLAGPYATMLLADHGATVIKVEPPSGDMTRGSGPYRDDDEQRVLGGYFQSINRNKESVVIDLKSEAGRTA